jgi:lysophospholipase L1-like esterase
MMKKLGVFFLCAWLPLAVTAQTGTTHLTCVGNSITEGSGYDSYPFQLGNLLGKGWTVLNCGVSGRTMLRHGDAPYWTQQKFKDALASNPDIVTISLGTNDSKPYNWIYKDEFVADYSAMVDTFLALPSHPTVWLCLPPPAFRLNYDIVDSIISTDIIPMIRQVAEAKGCPIVDFNTFLKSHSNLFPDGIHPNNEGHSVMAEYLFETLTQKAIDSVLDENAALGRPVTASGSTDPAIYGPTNLTDGDASTSWVATGFPSQAVVDLGSVQSVDLFGLNFGANVTAGYRFTLETATVADSWSAAVDRTARTDSSSILLMKTNAINARYVRLTITGAVHPKGDTVRAAEFRVLKENGGIHAPAVFSQLTKTTNTYKYFNLNVVWPDSAKGAVLIMKQTGAGSPFVALTGYRSGASSTIKEVIKRETVNAYYTVAFLNGLKVVSDTITFDARTTGVERTGRSAAPSGILLWSAYPNPFNPSTTIPFELRENQRVSLCIYDICGRFVAELAGGKLGPGVHRAVWNAEDAAGRPMPSGVYVARLNAGGMRLNRKLMLIR